MSNQERDNYGVTQKKLNFIIIWIEHTNCIHIIRIYTMLSLVLELFSLESFYFISPTTKFQCLGNFLKATFYIELLLSF